MHRHVLRLLAAPLLLCWLSAVHAAYPDKPIKILIGFTPGTTGDVLARLLAPRLAERLGQAVVVENRPGAGSSIAAEAVAKSPADGYTLLLSTSANVINANLSNSLKFDFAIDLVPVTLLAENPALLVVAGNSSVLTLSDLIAAAKLAPGRMSFGSSGNGTFTHLYGELFNQSAGIKLTHVPYKGSTQAMNDVLAGTVDVSFTPATPVLGLVKSGKLRALGVIGRERLAELPDVPTFAEAKVAGFDTALWFGLNAPTGTPREVIERWNSEIQYVLSLPDIRAQLSAKSINAVPLGAAYFRELIVRENEKWARLVKSAGIKAD